MAKELGICLGAISEDQDRLNKPMLSAVAVQVDGEPGSGFYTMAHTLKKYSGSEDPTEQRRFWEAELKKVPEFWRRKF